MFQQKLRFLKGLVQSVLCDVVDNTTELERTFQVIDRAVKAGFKWPSVQGVVEKCEEEIIEVKEALEAGNVQNLKEEVGDLLFTAAILSYYVDSHPESDLKKANDKFIQRFQHMEKYLEERKGEFRQQPLSLMMEGWCDAKRAEGGE